MEPCVHRFKTVSSTQAEARRLLVSGQAEAGHVVIAEEQSAGRGRFGRSWLSPRGGLYATFILDQGPILSIRAGLAVVRVLGSFGLDAELKWPNDVLVAEKKLGGILVEKADWHALVGVGINLTATPLPSATSAWAHGARIDRDALVLAVWEELRSDETASETLQAYRGYCTTIGRSVRISPEGKVDPIEGIACDVDESGRLVLETPNGRRNVSTGECHHLDG
ncbi:MAG: biotin--[acetyl-CoA-carboxylase] ligase [Candidatus Bipolaricaulia bacterium]